MGRAKRVTAIIIIRHNLIMQILILKTGTDAILYN